MITVIPFLYVRVPLAPVIIIKKFHDLIISKAKLLIMVNIHNRIDFKVIEPCKNALL